MTNAAIFGRLFFDRNADNTENNGTGGFDFGVVGQTVQLVNASGVYVQSVVTDGTGAYHFLDIPPRELLRAGADGRRSGHAGAQECGGLCRRQ